MNAVFIAFFMVMLFLPFLFIDLSPNRVSKKENRILAERPKTEDIKLHPEKFLRDFDAWFKDSTGFREEMISLYHLIDKNKLLNNGVRYREGQFVYLAGEEGHHFFAGIDGSLIRKFQGQPVFSDGQLRQLALKLKEVKTYLDRKSIPLVVMFCTDKESIYPEYYPKTIKRGPDPIQLDLITAYLKEHSGVDVFNIRDVLLAQKNNYLLYFLLDTLSFSDEFAHYNEIGAFFAYRELMGHINRYFPQLLPYEISDTEITYDEKEIPRVSLKSGTTYKRLGRSFFDELRPAWPIGWENKAFENSGEDRPVILFLCDSYAEEHYIGKYLAQHFDTTIFIHYGSMENFEEYIARFNPDIVVFESAERQLKWFSDSVNEIPTLEGK